MKKLGLSVFLAMLIVACGNGGGSTSPTPIPTPMPTQPAYSVTGYVSYTEFVLKSYSRTYGDLNYKVTLEASHAVEGCYVKVKWLDENEAQIGWTYAATSISIPKGQSVITDQDYMTNTEAAKIKNSLVEVNCYGV